MSPISFLQRLTARFSDARATSRYLHAAAMASLSDDTRSFLAREVDRNMNLRPAGYREAKRRYFLEYRRKQSAEERLKGNAYQTLMDVLFGSANCYAATTSAADIDNGRQGEGRE